MRNGARVPVPRSVGGREPDRHASGSTGPNPHDARAPSLRDRIEAVLGSGIVVCAGSGGVGKTTVSAAIALEAARRGRKTIVVTIDPAKRLANTLGLRELSNEPRRIPARKFRDAGLEPGPLYAMMLDTKRTFDELVIRYQPGRGLWHNRLYIGWSRTGAADLGGERRKYRVRNANRPL